MAWATYQLQATLYFVLARAAGKSVGEAVTEFAATELCRLGGDGLTVGMVYGLAEAAGYVKGGA